MTFPITVLIEVHNDKKNIKDCIESAQLLTSHIIVVDIGSTDSTAKTAASLGAKVYPFPFTPYVEPAREFGIKRVRTEWVLIIDSDERVTQELAEEILSSVSTKKAPHFKIPRKNIFGHKFWLKYGGWWPDYQIRLINKKYFKKWPKTIHSTPKIEGPFGILSNPILHFFHGDLENMVNKTIIFENIESHLLYRAKREVNIRIFFRKFLGELYRRMIKNIGFLDGKIGIIEAVYQAYSKTITYLYLYEKKSRPL